MDLATTRRALHAVAELVLAGPQYRRHGDIRLRVLPGGFATVSDLDVRVLGADVAAGEQRVPIDGNSAAGLAAALGLQATSLEDVYHEGSGVGVEEILAADPDHARYLARCFAAGDEALALLAPPAERVLWPEHFDVGITVDQVNYGVSPGDRYSAEPYAYVGPWQVPSGEFWNAPFGASRPIGPQPDVEAIAQFFASGRRAVPAQT